MVIQQSQFSFLSGLSQNANDPVEIVIICPSGESLNESSNLYLLAKELDQLGAFARLFLMDINSEVSVNDRVAKIESSQKFNRDRLIIDCFKTEPNTLLIFPEIFTIC